MMTPESKVKAQLKKILAAHGVYTYLPVSNGMGSPALDFICCYHGLYLSIETKKLGRKATPRQLCTIAQIREAGGKAMVFDGCDDHIDELMSWINSIG